MVCRKIFARCSSIILRHAQVPAQGKRFGISQTTKPKPSIWNPKTPNPKKPTLNPENPKPWILIFLQSILSCSTTRHPQCCSRGKPQCLWVRLAGCHVPSYCMFKVYHAPQLCPKWSSAINKSFTDAGFWTLWGRFRSQPDIILGIVPTVTIDRSLFTPMTIPWVWESHRDLSSGWWFGTFFLFSHIFGIIIPTD